MNINHFSYHTSSGKMAAHFSTTEDSFAVVQTDSIWDSRKRQLVLFVETSQAITDEIKVQMNDNNMTIEAPLFSSTIKLKSGYNYTHIASKLIDSNLIKVTLKYKLLSNYPSLN